MNTLKSSSVGRREKLGAKHLHLKFDGEVYADLKAFAVAHKMNVTQCLEQGAVLLLRRGKPLPERRKK